MYTRIEKIKESKSKLIASNFSQNRSSEGPAFQFVDKRPEVIVQKKLKNVMAGRQKQHPILQARADTEDQVRTQVQTPQDTPLQMGREAGFYGRDGKKKSRRVIDMEEFGDRNRIHNLDPNKLSESLDEDEEQMGIDVDQDIDKKKGIWRPSKEEGTARPEDPPIYQPFRKAFHNTHNILLSMQQDNIFPPEDQAKYTTRLQEIAANVKKGTKWYKSQVRSFMSAYKEIKDLREAYFKGMEMLTEEVQALGTEMVFAYQKQDEDLSEFEIEEIEELKADSGEDIWRQKWWAAVQKVNGIIGKEWSNGKANIQAWIKDKREKDGLPYMDENSVGDLDYIGSLAKGYKSAAKQYLRFLPELFDVDANLDAPPLAVYAITKGQVVDRGSVKGEEIPPLKDFEENVWKQLEKVPGMDKDDPFEVFIRADNVSDLMSGMEGDNDNAVGGAQSQASFSKRFQTIQDRIWWLRSQGQVYIKTLEKQLGKYITEEGALKKHVPYEPQNDGEYCYTEKDLTKMELYLKRQEKQVANNE